MRLFKVLISFLVALIGIAVQAGFATSAAVGYARGNDYEGAFVVWCLFVAILWAGVFTLSRAKNRDPLSWLLATFFFGPIPLAILAAGSRKQCRDEDVAQCPHCLSEVPKAASVCRFCQRDIPRSNAVADPNDHGDAEMLKVTGTCKYCGEDDAEIRSLDNLFYHRHCHIARHNGSTAPELAR